MKVKLILGSIREGRKTVHVAHHIYKLLAANTDVEVELIDLREWNLPQFVSRWGKEENLCIWGYEMRKKVRIIRSSIKPFGVNRI